MKTLLQQVRKCSACSACLPHGPRPILAADTRSRMVIIGQAPGRKVHESGVPWQDQSGDTLRAWLGVDASTFHDATRFALLPMGFCYPGTGRSGDLPPRPECAPLWHDRLLGEMKDVELILLIGRYAQARYLGDKAGKTLTGTVRRSGDFLPRYLPLPHPSPRNRIWLRRNPWFEAEVVPDLQRRVGQILRNAAKA
jgi:uracil-DNA glycosylase